MILNQMCPICSYLIHALLSQNQVCRDYALFGGHFWPKFGGRGHRNILKDRGFRDDTCHEYDNSNHTKGECGRVSQSFIVDELNAGSSRDGGGCCFFVYC